MLRIAAALPAVLFLALVAGADEPKTITVRGHGTVKAKPDTLVVTFNAKGSAEKATDAIEKLNKNVKTLKDELAAVLAEKKVQGATVEDSGVSFAGAAGAAGQVQVIWNGGGNQVEVGAPETNATSEIRVTVPAVDGMKPEDVAALVSSLLDKGQSSGGENADAGCFDNVFGMTRAGGASPVRFTISDPEAQLSKAWDEAVKKARARAETIASRLGLAVGGAVKVRDLSDDGAQDRGSAAATALNWVALRAGRPGTPVSSGETELSVALEVEFELTKADAEKK